MLDVIREEKISKTDLLNWINNSTLHAHERENRFAEINYDNMKIATTFLVDKNHKDGYELHIITWNAEIIIVNYDTKRLITVLFARPKQITRYPFRNPQLANRIIGIAITNERTGKNNI